MRLGERYLHFLESPNQSFKIIGIGGEAHVLQPLCSASAIDRCPPMRMTYRVEIDMPIHSSHIEAERLIKIGRLVEIGHAENETMKRVHGRCTGATRCCRSLHGFPPCARPEQNLRDASMATATSLRQVAARPTTEGHSISWRCSRSTRSAYKSSSRASRTDTIPSGRPNSTTGRWRNLPSYMIRSACRNGSSGPI